MGRPAIPKNIHILKGTAKKHPDRMRARENEPENVNPIGAPSKYLNKIEKKLYREIVNQCIPGVLGKADGIAVEMAARLLYKIRGFDTVCDIVVPPSASELGLFAKYLGQFGMNPVDRAKINIPLPKKKNKFDD